MGLGRGRRREPVPDPVAPTRRRTSLTLAGVPPAPRQCRTPREVEQAACDWLRYWGYDDARLTSRGSDGGVDVTATGIVAQVKAEAVPTGRPVVQAITGIAAVRDCRAAVFSWAGFTRQAVEFANQADVALYELDMVGHPTPVSRAAHTTVDDADVAQVPGVYSEWIPPVRTDLTIPAAENEPAACWFGRDKLIFEAVRNEVVSHGGGDFAETVWHLAALAASCDARHPGRRFGLFNRNSDDPSDYANAEVLIYQAGAGGGPGTYEVLWSEYADMYQDSLVENGLAAAATLHVPMTDRLTNGRQIAVDVSHEPEPDCLWRIGEPGSGLFYIFDLSMLPASLGVDAELVHILNLPPAPEPPDA